MDEGQLRKHAKFRSRILPSWRDLVVYLPSEYERMPQRRFPVLYLQDGQNLFDGTTSFIPGMDWHVGQTANRLIAQRAIQPLIIVGIYNTGNRRVREYTPTRDRRLGGGSADLYGRLLLEEIKPFIESEYRTIENTAETGLGGSSLGGLLTVYLGLRFPQVFGNLAVLSPSVWWNQRWILDFAARTRVEQRPRMWLDIGTSEGSSFVADTRRLRDILVEKGWRDGVDLHYEEVQGAQHNEAAWAQRVEPLLEFLFPAAKTAV